jgi:hypothetical protein
MQTAGGGCMTTISRWLRDLLCTGCVERHEAFFAAALLLLAGVCRSTHALHSTVSQVTTSLIIIDITLIAGAGSCGTSVEWDSSFSGTITNYLLLYSCVMPLQDIIVLSSAPCELRRRREETAKVVAGCSAGVVLLSTAVAELARLNRQLEAKVA